MWRSFANTLTNNTYENYLKKHLASSLSTTKNEPKQADTKISKEAEEMIKNHEYLLKKVEEQRKSIKETEENQLRRKQMQIKRDEDLRYEEKDKKISFMKKIRSYSSNKARKRKTVEIKKVNTEEEANESYFITSLRPSSPLKVYSKVSSRPTSQRNTVSLKEYQNKVMKDLKTKAPHYFNELKDEFLAIRKKSEQTFEQYKLSKKLKKSNPYDLRVKSRAGSNTEFISKFMD